MVRVLARRFGPYPFDTFGIAELPGAVAPPGFGGRSEQSYFIAHTDALDGPGVNTALFAHELAHMWLPNLVDSQPPGDDMLDEAVANYAVALYREATVSAEAAAAELIEGHPDFSGRGYFHYARLGTDEPLMTDYSPLIARAKGPWVYRMLRDRVGDDRFFSTLQEFIRVNAHRSVSLVDLRRAFLQNAPPEAGLDRFFREWLDRPGAPILDVTWERLEDVDSPRVQLRVIQRGEVYQLPLDIAVFAGSRRRDHRVRLERAEQQFVLESPGDPTSVVLDPNRRLLVWREEFGPPPHEPRSWDRQRWRAWFDREVDWLMKQYAVDAVSIATIENYSTDWASGYGVSQRAELVSPETRFDIGSLNRLTSDTGFAHLPPTSARLGWFFAELLKGAHGQTSALAADGLSKHLRAEREGPGEFGPARRSSVLFLGTGSTSGRLYAWAPASGQLALFVGYPGTGQGAVVLTEGGWGARQLAVHLVQRIGIQQGWPGVPKWGG